MALKNLDNKIHAQKTTNEEVMTAYTTNNYKPQIWLAQYGLLVIFNEMIHNEQACRLILSCRQDAEREVGENLLFTVTQCGRKIEIDGLGWRITTLSSR